MKFKTKILPLLTGFGLIAPTIVSTISLTSCGNQSYSIESQKEYDVVNSTFIKENSAVITYFNEHKSIPYISLNAAFDLLKYERSTYFTDTLYETTITYNSSTSATVKREAANGSSIVVDAANDTIKFSDFGKFMTQGVAITESYVRNAGVIQDYTSENINYIAYGKNKCRIRETGTRTLNLSSYNIDIVNYKNEIYLPFPTFSDIFLGDVYRPLVVLKNAIVCMYERGVQTTVPEFIKQNALDITDELLKFNYKETCFFLDNFYGFVNKRSYPSFDQIFTNNGLKEKMLTNAAGVDEAMSYLTAFIFDDSHSGYLYASPSDSTEFVRKRGPSGTKVMSEFTHYKGLRDQAYPSTNPIKGYEEVKVDGETDATTAVITFDMFTELPKTRDYYTNPPQSLEDVGSDAIGLFLYSYKQIQQNTNIKNVIVDLSCNGGGDERCLAFICAMISGGEFTSSYRNTVDNAINTCSFCVDANLDHKYDENDQLLKEKEVYVLASPFSFSCANALPLFTHDQDNVQLIGKRSGGGACVVLPAVNAIGTSYQVSGVYELGKVINGSFYDGDKGIDPVINVDDNMFFSNERKDLVKFIKSLQPSS